MAHTISSRPSHRCGPAGRRDGNDDRGRRDQTVADGADRVGIVRHRGQQETGPGGREQGAGGEMTQGRMAFLPRPRNRKEVGVLKS